MSERLVLLALLIGVAVLLSLLAPDLMSIAGLKARIGMLGELYERRPIAVILGFIAIQATALALCLPGAVLPMSLAAGALFGTALGTLVALAAITLGDSLGFLTARYVLRDLLARRFRRSLERIREGEGAAYLVGLRLMAIVPYFVVNIAMALTRMPLRHFAPLSFLALVPATFLYVNAGTRLAEIETPSDIWTPALLGSFVALGLLPFVARWLIGGRTAERK